MTRTKLTELVFSHNLDQAITQPPLKVYTIANFPIGYLFVHLLGARTNRKTLSLQGTSVDDDNELGSGCSEINVDQATLSRSDHSLTGASWGWTPGLRLLAQEHHSPNGASSERTHGLELLAQQAKARESTQ
jgi:hypothetical protein